MKQKGTKWVDADGNIALYVSPTKKMEERKSQQLLRLALAAERALQKFAEAAHQAYTDVIDLKIKEAAYKGYKKPSGGLTINSFDDTIEVKISKPNNIYFDNTYTEMVTEKFKRYFDSFGENNEHVVFLRRLVNDLLYTSGGRLDNSKVLILRKHRDTLTQSKKLSKSSELFIEAVDLFDKAINKKAGNTLFSIAYANKPHDKKRKVALKYTDV